LIYHAMLVWHKAEQSSAEETHGRFQPTSRSSLRRKLG
jgi:hypothetical protein